MRTVLVTGSDTGVGKTRVVAALARLLAGGGSRVQIVKVVETGGAGDAAQARDLSGTGAEAYTLASFPSPIAPAAAATAAGQTLSIESLVAAAGRLPSCDWRIFEGAGGIATPVDASGRDWTDFAMAADLDAVAVVVPFRLGAINQARLAYAHAARSGIEAGVWLNAAIAPDGAVAESTRTGLRTAGIPVWAEQEPDGSGPADLTAARARFEALGTATAPSPLSGRWTGYLEERRRQGLLRTLRTSGENAGCVNLADNDYLDLAHDPAVVAAHAAASARYGTSASASPLITGWKEPHADLLDLLCRWHGFPCGLLWTSGYAANVAVLGGLPRRGDLVLADRLVHASMIAGLLASGARLRRYEHLHLDQLEELLSQTRNSGRAVFVATESVFSMDGDHPDLNRLAALKRAYGFFWIVDEAHALGWYGPEGSGLLRAAGVEEAVDGLVGTLGKGLASGGAYSLFRDPSVRDHLLNTAGEFVYSTALPPANAAAAAAALGRMRELAPQQGAWQAASREFRGRLRSDGWAVPDGDSPIVPVRLEDAHAAILLADSLRRAGILAAAVRPPTVPSGTSRLRLSLKRTFGGEAADRVLGALADWRAGK